MNIPFVDLRTQYEGIRSDIDSAIQDVIARTAFIGGHYVSAFEERFANLYGVRNVISCANGTDSLYIIMKMLGIGAGDEVITVANSWISSSETITQTGARPVFVDAEEQYYSMDTDMLEKSITPYSKAVIAVHLHGQMCDIEKIEEICNRRKLFLIEDCAQSHFSETNGTRAGLFGIAGSFSFYPGKNLGAYGDAGCIITKNDELAEKFRMYARHGALKKHEHKIEGINSRLDGLQAAILNAKLPHILEWTAKRIENARLYNKYLRDLRDIITPCIRPGSSHTFHLYVVRAKERDKLKTHLEEAGIETAIHYPTALPNLEAYGYLNYPEGSFPVATKLQSEILSLPMYPELTEEMIAYVTNQIRLFYTKDK